MHAQAARKSLRVLGLVIVSLLLARCAAQPAYAETCTEKYSAMYEKDVAEVTAGKGGPLGQKIAINALARYYEDQWLICKQQENPDEQVGKDSPRARCAGSDLRCTAR